MGMWHVYGDVHIAFWLENVRERDHLEDPGVEGKIILKLIFRRSGECGKFYIFG
jgi:hypothetical protein